MAQNIHQSVLEHELEWLFAFSYETRAGVYNMICMTALKKHVLPRLYSPEPILLFCIGDYYNI